MGAPANGIDLTTLANLQQYLPSGATDNTLLGRLITAASTFIAQYCDRAFWSASYNEWYDGPGGVRLMLRQYPVTAVAVVSIDGAGNPVPLSSDPTVAGYVFTDKEIILRGGTWAFTYDVQNVNVQYTAGYVTAVPFDLEQACIDIVSRKYKERDRIGVVSKGLAGETVTFTTKDMTDDVKLVVNQYRKLWLT